MKKDKAKKKPNRDSDWEKQMEEEAETESTREKSGGGVGNVISIKGRKFTLAGESLGRELKCVVIDTVYLNSWYSKKYTEDSQGSIPACFAVSPELADMAPHENSKKPQADACAECPKNEWGSGGKRRKACRQGRKLAVIDLEEAGDAESIEGAEIALINVPPTSVKKWGTYVKDVKARFSRPFWAVATTVTFDQDADYPILEFDTDEKLDKEVTLAIKERREEIRELLMTPFQADDDDGDDDDDDEEDEKPAKKRVKKVEEDDEDEEDEKPAKKRVKKEVEEEDLDEDDEDEEDEDEESDESDDDDEEDEEDEEDEDEDEEDEEPRKVTKKKGSRFRRR